MFLFEYYPVLISVFLAFVSNIRLYSLYSFHNPTRQNPFVFSQVLYKRIILNSSRSLNKRPYKILFFNSFTEFRVFLYPFSYFPNYCVLPSCPISVLFGATFRILFPNRFIFHILEIHLMTFCKLLPK